MDRAQEIKNKYLTARVRSEAQRKAAAARMKARTAGSSSYGSIQARIRAEALKRAKSATGAISAKPVATTVKRFEENPRTLVVGQWNEHEFKVSPTLIRGFSALKIKASSETEDVTDGAEKYVKFKNGNPSEVNLTVHLNKSLGCDVETEAMAFLDDASAGATGYFYIAGKKLVTCQLMLTDASIGEFALSPDGVWLSAEIQLTMKKASKDDGSLAGAAPAPAASSGGGGGGGSKKTSVKKTSTTTSKKATVVAAAKTTASAVKTVAYTVKKVASPIVSTVKSAVSAISKAVSKAKKVTPKTTTAKKVTAVKVKSKASTKKKKK